MIIIIDNYDSFTYNLYQMIGSMYNEIMVLRNDSVTIEEIENIKPQAIIISPGPGYPSDAGISTEVIRHFGSSIPILGVCLGHQAIVEAFGGRTVKAIKPMHGKPSEIIIENTSAIFRGLPDKITVARYHSLISDDKCVPDCIKVTAHDEQGQIMAVEHKKYRIYGVQFHPESILTGYGKMILSNFLKNLKGYQANDINPKPQSETTTEKNALKKYISKLTDNHEHLTESEAREAMLCIMNNEATDAQIASLLTAMKINRENIDEITGFARGMREMATEVKSCRDTIDIVGTGGDMSNTFNISTTTSFVVASCGAKVAKHGNRSVSSKSGAADILENLGVKISTTPEESKKYIDSIGISFLFAQSYHSSMKYVAAARKQLGIKTIFNILGPLTNPARNEYILLGTYSKDLLRPMAEVLRNLGIKHAMLVYGNDCLDEISISSHTSVCEIKDNDILEYEISPADFGIPMASKEEIIGGTPAENAKITSDILSGKIRGAKRNIVIINAAAALYVCGNVSSIREGIATANEAIDSGKALEKMNQLVRISNGGVV